MLLLFDSKQLVRFRIHFLQKQGIEEDVNACIFI